MGIETTAAVLITVILAGVASFTAALVPDAPRLLALQPVMQEAASKAASQAIESLGTPAEVVTVHLSIIDDNKLRLCCIAGACGGAVISALMSLVFTPKISTREFLIKLIGSGLLGMLLSPWIIRYFKISPETDTVLGFSTTVALFGWGVLVTGKPVMEMAIAKWTVKKIGLGDPPNQ